MFKVRNVIRKTIVSYDAGEKFDDGRANGWV